MSQVPNFAKVEFADKAAPSGKGSAAPWTTPEGIAVKPTYSEKDLAGLDFLDTGAVLITDNPVEGVESQDTTWGLENCWG